MGVGISYHFALPETRDHTQIWTLISLLPAKFRKAAIENKPLYFPALIKIDTSYSNLTFKRRSMERAKRNNDGGIGDVLQKYG